MSDDVFDQYGMIVGIEEYLDAVEEYDWRDDHYECGCCTCCGCSCWELEDEDELPPDLQE